MKKSMLRSGFMFLIGMFVACAHNESKLGMGTESSANSGPKPETKPEPRPNSGGKDESKELKLVIEHQDKRFKDLETILDKNPEYQIRFPGKSAKDHALGTGIAKTSWPSKDHQKMIDHLARKIEALEKKYPGRIHFGLVGDFKLDTNTGDCDPKTQNPQGIPGRQNGIFMIHVWGANEGNFNFEDHHKGRFGSGQASCFSHQRKGVFGIVTMPSNDRTILMAPDKLLPQY